jgi:hypothetical protein
MEAKMDVNDTSYMEFLKIYYPATADTVAALINTSPKGDTPEELKKSGIFVQKFSDYLDRWGWFASSAAWEKKVWKPYVKEHYEIREREYEIVFKD